MSEPIILVIDDDPQVLAAIRRDLKARYQTEYRVLAAGSGESALETVRELKTRGDALAMLISDQRTPGMLGVDVLGRCRELYPLARRVLLTAYSDIQAAIRAINEVRLDHYLEKPWDPPEEGCIRPLTICCRHGMPNTGPRPQESVSLGIRGRRCHTPSRICWEAISFRTGGWKRDGIRMRKH